MNLLKIIREEVNEFEWAEEISVMDSLSDKERTNPYAMLKTLTTKFNLTRNEAMKIIAQHIQPLEKFKHEYDDDITYWTTDNSSSTFKFNYPPKWNSLTRKFVDWVRWNPGGTKNEFYQEVLGNPYPKGHQSQFFSSIKDSGIVKVEKGPRGSNTYTIGPNYENWVNGKLKRYMGMNVPWRQMPRQHFEGPVNLHL